MNNISCGGWIILVIVCIIAYAVLILPATAMLAFPIGGFTNCANPMAVAFPLASIFLVGCMIWGLLK